MPWRIGRSMPSQTINMAALHLLFLKERRIEHFEEQKAKNKSPFPVNRYSPGVYFNYFDSIDVALYFDGISQFARNGSISFQCEWRAKRLF